MLDWTPAYDAYENGSASGQYEFKIVATSSGGTDEEIFVISVTNVPIAPALDAIADIRVPSGIAITPIDANDGGDDNDAGSTAITYSCIFDTDGDGTISGSTACTNANLTGVNFNTSTGVLTWTPATSQEGLYLFQITATNVNGSDTEEFQMVVYPDNINKKISSGEYIGCTIKNNGELYCYGRNENPYSVGSTPTDSMVPAPTQVDMSAHPESNDFTEVSVGLDHICALHSGGKIFCWGEAFSGQLGNNSTTDQVTPVEIDMSSYTETNNFIKVAAGGSISCGIHSNGKAFCWGYDFYGQLGSNKVAAGNKSLIPLEVDTSGLSIANDFVNIALNGSVACGIHSNSKLYCWGFNSYSQVGDNSNTHRYTPTEVDMSFAGLANAFIDVSIANNSTCAIHATKKVFCWGADLYGGLGNGAGTSTPFKYPIEIDMSGTADPNSFRILATGNTIENNHCAINSNGKAYCWGENNNYQMGCPTCTTAEPAPKEVSFTHLVIANDVLHITRSTYSMCLIHSNTNQYCAGLNIFGKFGDGLYAGEKRMQEIDMSAHAETNDFSELSGLADTSGSPKARVSAIHTSGKLFIWGSNGANINVSGQASYTAAMPTPTQLVDMSGFALTNDFIKTSNSHSHVCAIHSSGRMFCWGQGTLGQLGDGLSANSETPVEIDMSAHAEINDFIDVATSGSTTCGVHSGGKIFCWGTENYGQLGQGGATSETSATPVEIDMTVPVESNDFIKVIAGYNINCGIHSGGKLFCWGRGYNYQLGNGSTATQGSPVEVDPSGLALTNDFIAASSNGYTTCGIHSGGKLLCWGRGSFGKVGDGATSANTAPAEVDMSAHADTNNFIAVSVGEDHTCGINVSNKVYCWGSNSNGQLGDNSLIDRTTPVEIDMSHVAESNDFLKIALYKDSTCAINNGGGGDDKIFCTGSNVYGELGITDPVDFNTLQTTLLSL
ncbi:MAG: putative Ig domain-containing protein [Halobacteriovoraceae bacterium]|nr:putative Ig domain-containing protein [Halobacteriovoraceae bacterium]MCB9095421.1 putative Ig domain-containing protein [Halobacteriovoraceae bacterium]